MPDQPLSLGAPGSGPLPAVYRVGFLSLILFEAFRLGAHLKSTKTGP